MNYVLVQDEQYRLGIEGPPPAGPMFQATETQTFIGVPVMLDKAVSFDGNGGLQQPVANEDLNTAPSQNLAVAASNPQGSTLPRGLLPPQPLQAQQQQQQTSASEQLAVIPANVVGPSTFVSEMPQGDNPPAGDLPPQVREERGGDQSKTMEGWVPLDIEGAHLAKGLGVKLQVEEDKPVESAGQGTRYNIRKPEVEIIPTNSVKLNDVIVGTKNERFPVYPGGGRNPKVVIHAQNVIIRDEDPRTTVGATGTSNIKQVPAYTAVPQLNNFLRDQLRLAAMNQLLQSHPLNNKPFPRPLTLREIAQAARNGQYPRDLPPDTLLQQASQLQVNIPHMVKVRPDAIASGSIQQHSKIAHPGGGGLGSLYRNLLQSEGAPELFDPRSPVEYSLLAALSGQNLKVPSVPRFKSNHASPDYGDSVGYKAIKDGKEPVQIVQAQHEPTVGDLLNPDVLNNGNLRQMSEQLLKQMIIQELQNEEPQLPHPGAPRHRPKPLARPRPVPYGTNAHPFAYLAGGQQGSPADAIFEETYEYNLPPGVSVEDFMNGDDTGVYGKRPGGPSYSGASDDGAIPVNKDTLMEFGKGLFYQALDFSRNHNPMTLFSKIRSLPPVKVDLYKVPMGIPEGLMDKLPEKWRSDGPRAGPPRPPSHKRGRRKNAPRKNNSKFY